MADLPESPTSAPALEGRDSNVFRQVVRVCLAFGGAILLSATLAGLLGRAAWWLDLTNHFRPHLAAALVLVTLLQLLARPRFLAAAWAAGAVVNLLPLVPLWLPAATPAGDARVTVVHANTGGDTVDAAALGAWVNGLSPDWVSLQEITPRNLLKIAAKLPAYELAADAPRTDTRGVALFRRKGIVGDARIVTITPDNNRPMVAFSFDLAGRAVSVLGFHTTRPAPANNWRWQREGTDAAALWAAAQQLAGGEAVLIGDFNATAQGVMARNLGQTAKLADARRGHGLTGTWPANVPGPLRIGIDAAYASRGLTATGFSVGPNIGSDHLPIAVTFADH